jgi:hypothetical protein
MQIHRMLGPQRATLLVGVDDWAFAQSANRSHPPEPGSVISTEGGALVAAVEKPASLPKPHPSHSRVPHLHDGLIVVKVGIRAKARTIFFH